MTKKNAKTQRARTLRLVLSFAAVLCVAGVLSTCSFGNDLEDETVNSEGKHPVVLQISAPFECSGVLDEIQELYVKNHTWVSFSNAQFQSSSDINAQLESGDVTDIVITDSKDSIDVATFRGFVSNNMRHNLFTTDLVIVAAKDSEINTCTLEDIATGSYTLSLGGPEVASSAYAKQALKTVSCYEDQREDVFYYSLDSQNVLDSYLGTPLQDKVMLASNCDELMDMVASEQASVGIVFASDVYDHDKVKIVGTIAPNTHGSINFSGAVFIGGLYPDEANDFLLWCLSSKNAKKVLERRGFHLV